jgi:Kef-type K+ transport system membrane component KefB
MFTVDTADFLIVVATAAVAATAVTFGGRRIFVPVVVLELVLGIVIGPDVLDISQPDSFITFFANLGLGMLFFFAGYEIDFERIRGQPLRLALIGWALSLALAYALGGLLVLSGLVLSTLFVGSAMATTAIGTLIPILDDADELTTRFGTYLLAAGAVGEFGPILLITFFFSTDTPLTSGLILMLFIAVAVLAAVFAIRWIGAGWETFQGSLETSSQLPIRVAVVLIFTLAFLANHLGLDLLLGDPRRIALVPIFAVLFLVVRGVPAVMLYRKILDLRDRAALAFFSSTELPLVVAITTIAVAEDRMRTTTAAALVGAAVVSTALYPLFGLRLRGSREDPEGI